MSSETVTRVMPTASTIVTIDSPLGLHARPAMALVDLANQFKCDISVYKEGPEAVTVDGKSVMQVITLEAIQGTVLRIEATGEDAQQAIEQISKLARTKFGEEE